LKKKLLTKQRKEQQSQARQVFNQNQEIKRESGNLVWPIGFISQTPNYWPTLTQHNSFPNIPLTNPSSIQDYNLKEVEFYDNHQLQPVNANNNCQYPCDIYFPQDQLYCPSTMNNINSAGLTYVNQQQLDGSISTSTESSSWGDMSSLIHSPLASDYEGGHQQTMIQEDFTFEESMFYGMIQTQ
jgi:transcription factor MYB, plant